MGSHDMDSPNDPSSPFRVSRRGFIIGSGVAAAAVGVAGYASVPVLRDELRPELDPDAPTGRLDEEERRTLLALVQVLVPDRYRQRDDQVRAMLDDATLEVPGLVVEYRYGARLLNEVANQRRGATFASLQPDDRDAILDRLLWRYDAEEGDDLSGTIIKLKRRAERAWHDEPRRRFRELVVRDLLYRAYGAVAPLLIGYSNIPGVAGNPRDYVDAPSGDGRHDSGAAGS